MYPYSDITFKHPSYVRRTFNDLQPGSLIIVLDKVMLVLSVNSIDGHPLGNVRQLTALVKGRSISYHVDVNVNIDSYGWREL